MLLQTIDQAHAAMRNWARWARDDDPGLDVPPPPWARDYRATAAWEAGWGDPGAPEALSPPVDERAALAIEHLLLRLPRPRWMLLRRHYLKAPQPELELQAALRALVDLSHAAYEAIR